MTTNTLLDTELRYVADDGTEVTTSVRHVDQARVARGLPVRKIRSRAGQRHYSGLFWSATTQGHVPYESRLELDRLWLADFDSSVTWIAAQPFWTCGSNLCRWSASTTRCSCAPPALGAVGGRGRRGRGSTVLRRAGNVRAC